MGYFNIQLKVSRFIRFCCEIVSGPKQMLQIKLELPDLIRKMCLLPQKCLTVSWKGDKLRQRANKNKITASDFTPREGSVSPAVGLSVM